MAKVDKYPEDGKGGKKAYLADVKPWKAPSLNGGVAKTAAPQSSRTSANSGQPVVQGVINAAKKVANAGAQGVAKTAAINANANIPAETTSAVGQPAARGTIAPATPSIQLKNGATPQSTSLYDRVMDLYKGAGNNLPETSDRSAQIDGLYREMYGRIPEAKDYSSEIRQEYERMYGRLPENQNFSDRINDVYDKNRDAQLLALANGHDEVMRALNAAGEKIPEAYQAQGNALAGEYERQRASMNERMAASGINSGAGTQAALVQNAGYLNGAAQIKQAQADAQAELERERVNQEAKYRAAISEALANNDYQRAVALTQEMKDYQTRATQLAQMALSIDQSLAGAQASERNRQAQERLQIAQMGLGIDNAKAGALTNEWNRQDQQRLQLAQMANELNLARANAGAQALSGDRSAALEQAKTLAGYGDFSGFAQIYGQDTADNMRMLWLVQNPRFAYMTGNLSAGDYYKLTGEYAPGTEPQYGYVPTAAATGSAAEAVQPLREVPTPGGYTNTQTTTGDEPTLRDVPTPGGTSGTAAAPTNRLMYDLGLARNEQEFTNIVNQLNAQGNLTAQQQQAIMDRYNRLYGRGN